MVRRSVSTFVAVALSLLVLGRNAVADGAFTKPTANAAVNGGDAIELEIRLNAFDAVRGWLQETSVVGALSDMNGNVVANVPVTVAWLSPSNEYLIKNDPANPATYPNQTASFRVLVTGYYDPGTAIWIQRVLGVAVNCTQ